MLEFNNVTKSFGDVKAVDNISFKIEAGKFFSLLGPSGCGKTTTLRLIAGLERLDNGDISINKETISSKDTWVAPEKRGIGIVFQDYALFPHMTVYENVAFGLKGLSKTDIRERVEKMLSTVGLIELEKRFPHELSGGQCQRVALARSLAPLPKVILLDEPFSNLDAELRDELRNETKRILQEQGITTILVTHDQEEAFSLSDKVGVLNKGRLEQLGTPSDIYHRPKSRFVADFVGKADFVSGVVKGKNILSNIGTFPLNTEAYLEGQKVDIMIRPDDVDFVLDANGNGTIIAVSFLGASVLYKIRTHSGETLHSIKPSSKVMPNDGSVKITVDAAHIVTFPC